MYALKSDANIPMPWILLAKIIMFVLVLVKETKGFPIYPASKEWVCNSKNVIYNATLQGGIRSGKFRKVGIIGNMDACTRFCCNDRNCDVAFMAKQNCYLVTCRNKYLCSPVTTASPRLYPRLAYVTRTFFNAFTKTVANQVTDNAKGPGFGDVGDDKEGRNSLNNLDIATSRNLQETLLRYDNSLQNIDQPGKKDRILKSAQTVSSEPEVTVYSSGCYPAKIHKGVSLRYGTHSGEFYDYGEIGDMRMCVDLCCKDKKCDVAFMVGKTCYTISCSSFDFCQMVPSTKQPSLPTQLAYVIKKKSVESKKKLLISENHEKFLHHQLTKQANKKNHLQQSEVPRLPAEEHQSIEMGTPKSDIFSSEEPNIPKKFTKGCRNNRVLRNYGLIGGQRAGVYTLRGITPDFDSCIGLCCSEMMCDAALLLGRKCFSVQCFKNGACAGRPATTHGLRSKLAFVERKDDDIGEKRTSIPGLLPTDRQYTVYLNITSEDFKEGLRDRESLEFLNFAQALRVAVTGILGNVEGFKYIEILKFKPNKVIAVFNITTDQKTHPKVLLQLIVDSLRKGELKTYDQPFAGKLILDVRGFKFFNAKGDDLVCSPEFNYDAHWPLAIFGTSVNIPCPRDAAGLTNRKCKGSDDELAKWDTPDFSDCVSQKYEDLFKEAQLLNSASVHSPELTPASIIDRLLQLTTSDTYGSSPPTTQRRHGLRSRNRPIAYKAPKAPVNRESLHTPQIENLRKLVADKFKEKSKTVSNIQNGLQRQNQRPKINLLPFFRGPTAKAIKPKPIAFQSSRQNNVKINSINIVPNRLTGNVPNYVPEQKNGASSQPKQYASLIPYPKQGQGGFQTPGTQSIPVNQNAQHQQASLWPQNIPTIRNLERAYSPDYRKFNGNPKVDPTLLLSEAHWSKPEKIQPKPRAVPLQSPPNQDYPGHVFHTISLPVQNTAPKPQPAWDYSRKLPVKSPLSAFTATGKMSPIKSQQLFARSPPLFESSQSRNNLNNQNNGPNYRSNFRDRLYVGPATVAHALNHQLNSPLTVSKQDSLLNAYKSNLGNQIGKLSEHNRKDFVVSIKKRSLDSEVAYGTPNTTVANTPSSSDIAALGFDPRAIPKAVNRRDVLNEDKFGNSDSDIQANVLESLINVDSDGDDPVGNRKTFQGILSTTTRPKNLDVTGEATKLMSNYVNFKTPTIKSVSEKDAIMKMLQENVKKMATSGLNTPEPFRIIEKASYRPNEEKQNAGSQDDDSMEEKKYEKPIIVDVPNTAKVSDTVLDSLHHANKTQQGTSLDLSEGFARMNGEPPADPRETSSYTEAHLDNPAINAIASAKILHDDNVASDGRAISNIEISGIQGQPSSQAVAPPQSQDTVQQGNTSAQTLTPDVPKQSENQSQGNEAVSPPTEPSVPEEAPPKQNESQNNEKMEPTPIMPDEVDSHIKGIGDEKVEQGNVSSENSSEVKEKPEQQQNEEEEKNKEEEKIPLLPLQDITPTESNIPLVANKPYSQNEVEIPEVPLKKLTVNETEENPDKSGGKTQESELIFEHDKEHGMNRSAMFGGDILLSADIIEELSNYMQRQTEAPSPQEVKEFLEAASAILDENNAHEWKNAQRHMKVIANEGDIANGEVDVQDWRSLHKMQSKRKPNVLMELVDDIEEYGKAAARMITKYNPVFQKPVFTSNILMQFKVLIVEDLDDRPSSGNAISFPNYTNPNIAKWMTSQDQVSLPAHLIAETIQPTSMIHITFFLFKTVYKLQRFQEDMDEDDEQEILDENPMKVGSELVSMSVDPPLSDNLKVPVTINLEKSSYDSKAQHECAFWNTTTNDWSTKGCKLVSFNDTHATCECNHLTTYGILVDSSKPQAPVPPDYGGSSNKPAGGSSSSDSKKPIENPPEKSPGAVPPPVPPAPSPKTTSPEAVPSQGPSNKKPSDTSSDNKNNILFWLLICLVILLIILLLCLCCLFCWLRRRKKEEPTKTKETGSSSGSGTSVGSEMLVDKSKLPPKGDPSPRRSVSPHPRDSPGWLKLKSHADHRDEMLMREKALLFSDYHQPYNFLSHEKERPNTSLESVYGGSEAPTPKPSSSSSSSKDAEVAPVPTRRPDHGRLDRPIAKDRRPKAPSRDRPMDKKAPPRDVRKREMPLQRGDSNPAVPMKKPNGTTNRNGVQAPKRTPESGSTPMEWDPYYLNTKKNEEEKKKPDKKQNGARKKSRNFSPISEEDSTGQETEQPIDSVAPQVGSEIGEPGPVSESIYPMSSTDPSEDGTQAQMAPSSSRNTDTLPSRNRSPPGAKQMRNQTTQIGGKR